MASKEYFCPVCKKPVSKRQSLSVDTTGYNRVCRRHPIGQQFKKLVREEATKSLKLHRVDGSQEAYYKSYARKQAER